MNKKGHSYKTREWLADRIDRFSMKSSFTDDTPTIKKITALIGELRAIADEAELRIDNPRFPSNE